MAHRGLHMQLPVVLSNQTTNFISIPTVFAQNVRASLPQKSHGVIAFRLGWLGPPSSESGGLARPCQAFVGWTNSKTDGHFIQVPWGLAESLGLKNAVDYANATAPDTPLIISVAVVPFAPVAARVDVDPVTADDWDILQMHANFVEEELLSQICVLGPGQKFPMWVHGQTKINMHVTNISLVEQGQALCVRLARNTEVVVAPKLRAKEDQYRAQSLRQRELDHSKQAVSYQLRVQNCEHEEESNSIATIHPSTLKRLIKGAAWPACSVLANRNVVYDDDPTRVLVVLVCNRKRPLILEKLRKAKKSVKKTVSTLMSATNQVYLKVVVSEKAALGHVVLPRSAQIRIKVKTLETVILSLPRFEPIPCPVEFPSLCVHLTPISGPEEVALNEAVPDNKFALELISATQSWQKCMHVRGGGVPISDGTILALPIRKSTGMTRKGGRVVYVLVRIDESGDNSSPSNKKSSTVEPVYWFTTFDAKVEWQVDKYLVGVGLQKVASWVGSALENSPEDISSTTSNSNGSDANKRLLAQGVSVYNSDYYAHHSLEKLGAVQKEAQEMFDRLNPMLDRASVEIRLALGAPHPGGVYLCGGRGAGKTALARAIAREYRCSVGSLAHTVWVSCASLRGGKRSEIESTISSAFKEALRNAPSLVVFDDLDLLLPAPAGGGDSGGGGGGAGGEDAQLVWLAEWIEDILHQYQTKLEQFESTEDRVDLKDRDTTHRCISWIATGREKTSLRGSLIRTGLFDKVVEIQPLTARDRTAVLDALLSSRGLRGETIDLDDIAGRAEGYAPADLDTLTERAMHCALTRLVQTGEAEISEEDVCLEHGDFIAALDGFTPAALRGVALAKSDVNWSDVGGLSVVRRTLKETLELPIQFAQLYDRSPQRLASGILLYGPPGCGKTLLAGAVAKECGLNFISVKGPEVLNKYIGASEQAVRDLFARGAAAAPCIVFFDEFDAVAPRRGNDSSGVTDRVVNQLLTFLDGVETRSGVYVMAATSRPDLVDPALLRPGRLDKQLLCGFPDSDERADILKTIAGKMELSKAALSELDTVARLPEAELFTGADLQAILYSAQLDTVHSQIPTYSEKEEKEAEGDAVDEVTVSKVVIEPRHIRKALSEARPSVSKEERERYKRIYEAFKGGRGADFNAVSGYPDGKQRTALK